MKEKYPYLLVLALLATIWLCSGQSRLASPGMLDFAYSDKLIHFFVFGLIATSICRLPLFKRSSIRIMLIAVLLTSLFGAIDELHQAYTPGRSMDVLDWIADTSGALLAVLMYYYSKTYNALLEESIVSR